MSTNFLHGPELIEVDAGPRPIETVRSSVIAIIGTAPNADAAAFPLNKPVLIAGSRREAAKLRNAQGESGAGSTLPDAVDSILDQAGAVIVVVRVADSTPASVLGSSSARTGVYAFLASESVLGVQPRILIAPGFTGDREEDAANPGEYLINPVVAALETVAKQLRAVVFADGPNTDDASAVDYASQLGSTGRVYIADPAAKRYDAAGNLISIPSSAILAGVQARVDNEKGFWWSLSNQPINNIVGLDRPIDFVLGSDSSRANLLNEANVGTIININGYRVWGNRVPTQDPRYKFLCVRRTADIINDSILRAHLWAVDRGINKTYLKDVADGVNAYLRDLVNRGAILGGSCWPDPDLNSESNIANGQVFFNFDFTPVYPAERVVFRSQITNDYIEELV